MHPFNWRPVLAVAATLPTIGLACIHPPSTYKGPSVSERVKVAFLFHDGTNAHLVIRTTLAAKDGLPAEMAWVVPVPSLPSKYEEAPAGIFEVLHSLIPRPMKETAKSASVERMAIAKSAAPAPQIRLHEKVEVGNYQIQPIEILSESGGGELNAWLAKNGFGQVPPENQKYYLRKGAAFLAIRIAGLKSGEAGLKPLHIAYRSSTMQLPLKFSTHSGVFDVRLYTFTQQPPSPNAFESFGLRADEKSCRFDQTVGDSEPTLQKLVGKLSGYVTEFVGEIPACKVRTTR